MYDQELNFLSAIPGVSVSPERGRGVTVDEEVVNQSEMIRHIRSASSNTNQAVWIQKRSSTLASKSESSTTGKRRSHPTKTECTSSFSEMSFRKKSKRQKPATLLNRSEGELIEEWKIRCVVCVAFVFVLLLMC